MQKTTLKVTFNDPTSNRCHRETEIRMKNELLKHTGGSEVVLKALYDEACRGITKDSTWEKIEAVSRFNALAGLPNQSINHGEFIYEWIRFEEKRGLK